jgi:hypothetical protein
MLGGRLLTRSPCPPEQDIACRATVTQRALQCSCTAGLRIGWRGQREISSAWPTPWCGSRPCSAELSSAVGRRAAPAGRDGNHAPKNRCVWLRTAPGPRFESWEWIRVDHSSESATPANMLRAGITGFLTLLSVDCLRSPPAGNDDNPSVHAGQSGPAALPPSESTRRARGDTPRSHSCDERSPSSGPARSVTETVRRGPSPLTCSGPVRRGRGSGSEEDKDKDALCFPGSPPTAARGASGRAGPAALPRAG